MHPHDAAVAFQVPQFPFPSPESVFAGSSKDFKKLLPVFLVNIIHNIFMPLFQLHRACPCDFAVLLIYPQKLHLVSGHVIQAEAAKDIIEHSLTEDIIMHQLPGLYPVNGFCRYSPEINIIFIRQDDLALRRRHRTVKIIPLPVDTAHIQQKLCLFPGFHSLRDHPKLHKSGHIDDCLQDSRPPARALFIHFKELHVDFEHIHLDVVQHIQGRVSASEIIHEYQEPGRPQILYYACKNIILLRIGALRDLYFQQARIQIIFCHQIAKAFHNINRVNVHP